MNWSNACKGNLSKLGDGNNNMHVEMNHAESLQSVQTLAHSNDMNDIHVESLESKETTVFDKNIIRCSQCHKTFSTKQSLATHMKTAKYCLENKPKQIFECEYCKKRLSSKQMMLYHDNICNMKGKYLYDKKMQEIESIIHTQNTNNMKSSPKSFYETNVIIQCKMLSDCSKIPTKINALTFEIFPCLSDETLTIMEYSCQKLSTGVQFQIPNGWCAYIMSHNGFIVSNDIIHSKNNDEIQITLVNISNQPLIIDNEKAIAKLVFQKSADTFNVHFNCVSTE